MPPPPILVVDDSPSVRRMVAACLRADGFEVTESPDAGQALDLAGAQAFAMVLTDQVMPGTDGLSLIRALRAMPRYAGVPVLMLTTESDDDIRARAREAGASGFLPKPFDPEQLMASVKALLAAPA